MRTPRGARIALGAGLALLAWLAPALAGDPELRPAQPKKSVAPRPARPRPARRERPPPQDREAPGGEEREPAAPAPAPVASVARPPAAPGLSRVEEMLERRRRGEGAARVVATPSLLGTWLIGSEAALGSGYATRIEISVQERDGTLSGRWLTGTNEMRLTGRATPAEFEFHAAVHDDFIDTTYRIRGALVPGDLRPARLTGAYSGWGASSRVELTRMAAR